VRHTVAFGTEFGARPACPCAIPASSRTTVTRLRRGQSVQSDLFRAGPLQSHSEDANSKYKLNISSGYAQDQIELTRWLQLFVGARYDSFDLTALDQNTNIRRERVDNNISPRAAVIVKPVDNLSVYNRLEHLVSAGVRRPVQCAEPRYADPAAAKVRKYRSRRQMEHPAETAVHRRSLRTHPHQRADRRSQRQRTVLPVRKPQGPRLRTALTGYITPAWQSILGYAYTDAKITSDTSPTIVAGNRVQLVPYNQFAWWNKYQIDPLWSVRRRVIISPIPLPRRMTRCDCRASFARCGGLQEDQRTWRAQLNVEISSIRGIGRRRRQQQHLTRPAADGPAFRDGQILGVLERGGSITFGGDTAAGYYGSSKEPNRRFNHLVL